MGQFTFSGGGGGGGGAVSSVFTRTGAVVALTGDYTASQVTNVPAGNIGAVTVQAAIDELDTEKAGLALANTFTTSQVITSTVSTALSVNGDNQNGAVVISRYQNTANGGNISQRKARGTFSVPLVVNANDAAALSTFSAYGGTGFRTAGQFEVVIIEPTPSDTAMGSSLRWSATALGSLTQTEVVRLEVDTGLSMYGANPVIDNNRIFRPRSYTIGTLPSITTTGIVHCSDLGGGAGLLQSNGTVWMRVRPTGTTTIATDAGHTATWQPLTNAPVIRGNATLTATRTYTLGTTNAANGVRVRVIRLGGGAFNWDIVGGTTFSLTGADQYCEFEFDGTTWNLSTAGRISVAAGGSTVDVQDEGIAVVTATTLNFVGAGVTATNGGGGVATITIPGGGSGGLTIGKYVGLQNASNF